MVTFNIASIPDRVDLLVNTVNSIIDQVDQVNLFLNNYQYNPYFHNKVRVEYGDNSLGDAGKMYFCTEMEGYYFTGDDDIIYPPTYVEDTIKKIDNNIVSYHGRSFLHFPINSYYKSPCEKIRCLDECKQSRPVQFGGTGVMAFHLDTFRPNLEIFKKPNMCDVWIGLEADFQGIEIMGLEHTSDYFEYQPPLDTIYDQKVRDCLYETELINNYFHNKKN